LLSFWKKRSPYFRIFPDEKKGILPKINV